MKSQKQDLFDYLQHYGCITARTAVYELGITQLSARIIDLEDDGWIVPRNSITVTARNGRKCRVTEYHRPYRQGVAA